MLMFRIFRDVQWHMDGTKGNLCCLRTLGYCRVSALLWQQSQVFGMQCLVPIGMKNVTHKYIREERGVGTSSAPARLAAPDAKPALKAFSGGLA